MSNHQTPGRNVFQFCLQEVCKAAKWQMLPPPCLTNPLWVHKHVQHMMCSVIASYWTARDRIKVAPDKTMVDYTSHMRNTNLSDWWWILEMIPLEQQQLRLYKSEQLEFRPKCLTHLRCLTKTSSGQYRITTRLAKVYLIVCCITTYLNLTFKFVVMYVEEMIALQDLET